ncbi:MAG: diguanylate cyclase [Pseudomonadota bacterium]
MPHFTTEELQSTLQQLEQAIYNHEQWSKAFDRTLICRTPHDERDVAEDAHCRCQFGRWYYHQAPNNLRDVPAFRAIGAEHQIMHQQAARLLLSAAAGQVVSTEQYDVFATALERLRLEIHSLKQELSDSLYNRDPLTGAESRKGLLGKLREQQELVQRGVQNCAVVMMDLDHFKAINDMHGHATGDRVLVAATRYVMDHLRQYDRLYRYGGEEFALCLPGVDLEAAFKATERLRKGIGELVVEAGEGTTIRVTASCGICLIAPNESVEETLDRADRALYRAKRNGRNRTEVCEG